MPLGVASQAQITGPAFVFWFAAGQQHAADQRIGAGIAVGSSGLQFTSSDDCDVKDVSPTIIAREQLDLS